MFFKRILPFSLVIMVVLVCSLNAEDYVGIEKKPGYDCDAANNFVCATNNVTYKNECVLKKCVAKDNPGHCKRDEEQTVKSEDKRQKRGLNRPKHLHGLHQRKSLLPQRFKHKPVRAKLYLHNSAKKFVRKLDRPLQGKVNIKYRTNYRAARDVKK